MFLQVFWAGCWSGYGNLPILLSCSFFSLSREGFISIICWGRTGLKWDKPCPWVSPAGSQRAAVPPQTAQPQEGPFQRNLGIYTTSTESYRLEKSSQAMESKLNVPKCYILMALGPFQGWGLHQCQCSAFLSMKIFSLISNMNLLWPHVQDFILSSPHTPIINHTGKSPSQQGLKTFKTKPWSRTSPGEPNPKHEDANWHSHAPNSSNESSADDLNPPGVPEADFG